MREEWDKFKKGIWTENSDVENFIQENYTLYEGDEKFLAGISPKTNKVWNKCLDLLKKELKKGVLDIDVDNMSGINGYMPGYIDK